MTRKPFGSSIAISVCLWVYSPKSMADCVTPWAVVSDLDDQAHTRFMNMSDANRDDFTTVFCHDYMDFHCYAVQGWPHWELSTTEWAEWSNAAWIVNFGITSDNMPTGGCVPGFCVNFNDCPWHGRRDYRRLGKSCHTTAHDEFDAYYLPGVGANNAIASFNTYDFLELYEDEWEELYCQLFDASQFADSNPIERASSLVHEGQHAWQWRYHDDHWHDGKCPGTTSDCDNWNYHRRYDVAEGDLYRSEHRPYQVEWEFACDIAEHYNDSLPLPLVIKADSWAVD